MTALLRIPFTLVGLFVEAVRPPRLPPSYPAFQTNEEIDASL